MVKGAEIQITDLVKTYGSFKAIDKVSLTVKAGEFLTLLGSSGSGKTTTLMAVAGFVEPDSGEIRLDGKDLSSLAPEKRGLGIVFQNYALFPNYDVFENIAFPLRLRRVPKQEIDKLVWNALELIDLTSCAKRRISELSGGQQQRVALARAFVFSPPVLLMDEPLGALDRKLREQLQSEIKKIQRNLGVTVIYVTHDQEEALAMSDRIAIMSHGRIAQLGTPEEVYEQPSSPFVAGFLGESNLFPVSVSGQEGDSLQLKAEGDHTFLGRWGGLDHGTDHRKTNTVAMVRPESFRLHSGAEGSGNKLRAEILQRDFLGPSVRLTVASSFGEVIARIPRRDYSAELEVGSTIDLTWNADETRVFAEETVR